MARWSTKIVINFKICKNKKCTYQLLFCLFSCLSLRVFPNEIIEPIQKNVKTLSWMSRLADHVTSRHVTSRHLIINSPQLLSPFHLDFQSKNNNYSNNNSNKQTSNITYLRLIGTVVPVCIDMLSPASVLPSSVSNSCDVPWKSWEHEQEDKFTKTKLSQNYYKSYHHGNF